MSLGLGVVLAPVCSFQYVLFNSHDTVTHVRAYTYHVLPSKREVRKFGKHRGFRHFFQLYGNDNGHTVNETDQDLC